MSSKLFGEFANFTSYSADVRILRLEPLTEEEFAACGRLVRAFAEIEDCLNLFICSLAGISETQGTIMLSKTGYVRRVDMARRLAEKRTDKAINAWLAVFTTGLSKINKCRNAIAHGVYMGRSAHGRLSFLTKDEVPSDTESGHMIVMSFPASDALKMAITLEHSLPDIVRILKIEPLRERRYTQALLPHPKAPRKSHGVKRQPPRLPSRE